MNRSQFSNQSRNGQPRRQDRLIRFKQTVDGQQARGSIKARDVKWQTATDEASGTHCFEVGKIGGTYALRNNRNDGVIITGDERETRALYTKLGTMLGIAAAGQSAQSADV